MPGVNIEANDGQARIACRGVVAQLVRGHADCVDCACVRSRSKGGEALRAEHLSPWDLQKMGPCLQERRREPPASLVRESDYGSAIGAAAWAANSQIGSWSSWSSWDLT